MAAILAIAQQADALTITLPNVGGYDRYATLSSATDGAWGTGNTQASDVDAAFSGMAPWTARGEATAALPTGSGLLTISVDSGGWGQPPVSGTWTLDSSYWTMYEDAVISMHVGGGNSATGPDQFMWLIERGQLTGTWSYDSNSGTGGGLSNLKLWSAGTGPGSGGGSGVPDAGATMVLFGVGLVGVGALRRRLTR